MVIKHNMPAINANRQFGVVSNRLSSSTEKLSSGYKINRSADDAAGLSISEKMRKQIRGLNRAAENIEDGISYAQVADGALNEIHDMLQRMNELSVQAANGTNSDSDRTHINNEVQQLKAEMERIFVTTSFNEKQIWKEDITVFKGVIGQVSMQSATPNTPSSQKLVINNETYGLLPINSPDESNSNTYHKFYNSSNSYKILADDVGVSLEWSAYNGTKYKTKAIDWDTLRENNFKFNIGDYFENKDSDGNEINDPTKQLLDANGDPKFGFDVSFSVITGSTNEQIAKAINNTYMGQSMNSYTDVKNTTSLGSGISLGNASFVYAAAYADATLAREKGVLGGYDFEDPKNILIEPKLNASGGNMKSIPNKGATVDTARNSTGKWEFAFEAKGLGNLTAAPSQVTYFSGDTIATPDPRITPLNYTGKIEWSGRDADDKGIFWTVDYKGAPPIVNHQYQNREWRTAVKFIDSGTGTLGDVMKTLTGVNTYTVDGKTRTDGLLSKNASSGRKGDSDSGGTIVVTFDITSDNEYVYGKDANGNDLKSNIVGSFTVSISVGPSDTEQTILDRLNTTFNDNTLFELNFTTKNSSSVSHSRYSYNTSIMLKNDFLPGETVEDINLNIHSGSETTDKINLDYECLRLKTIGLSDTNVLTQENALAAIDEISSALEMISAQRSLFGAYQNRMEHAYNIDKNTSENTQAAESQIRDTDMAEEMVNYSNLSILGQAGQSMLAQANQQNQGILNLLK